MSACGRLRSFISAVFTIAEHPLSGNADVRIRSVLTLSVRSGLSYYILVLSERSGGRDSKSFGRRLLSSLRLLSTYVML